uniref:Uncharacterized protein n=1 Tax=Arundo donax TaxID=35708 RepID=A0A0A8Z246_ARUDO
MWPHVFLPLFSILFSLRIILLTEIVLESRFNERCCLTCLGVYLELGMC